MRYPGRGDSRNDQPSTLATAGTTIGRIGSTRSIRSRGGRRVAAHASNVPSTSAMTSEPSARRIVVRSVSAIDGRVKALR